MKQEESELKIDELTGRIALLAGSHLWVEIQTLLRTFYTDASLDAYEKGIRDAAEKAKQVGVPMLNHTYRDYIDKCLLMREKINSEILSLLTKPKDKDLDDCFPLG